MTLLRITLTTNSTTTKCGTKYTAQAIHKFAQCSIFVPGFGFQLSVFALRSSFKIVDQLFQISTDKVLIFVSNLFVLIF